jgi:alanyl-tRNA synthetase
MHHALREVLGKHVEQKGSLVTPDRLRFDFSHFRQVTPEELSAVEEKVNSMIMQNIISEVHDHIPMEDARAMGAIALFGEKYGDRVRVVRFGDSVELCGGTHVAQTSRIGLFKIVSEGAIAAGVRRIEAVTGRKAVSYINEKLSILGEVTALLHSTGNPVANISKLMAENAALKASIEKLQAAAALSARNELAARAETAGNCRIYSGLLEETSADTLKNIAHQIRQTDSSSIIVIGSAYEGKASLVVGLGNQAAGSGHLNAVEIIKAVSGEINGGGGGQPFLATAGGKNPEGLPGAVARAVEMAKKML